MLKKSRNTLIDKKMIFRAIKDSLIKLNPKIQANNPVMLLVYISAVVTSVLWILSYFKIKDASTGFTLAIAVI